MSKILFYSMGLEKGGAERVISNLANTFINNHDVVIVTNNKCESKYDLDFKIKHICIDTKKGSKIISKLSSRRTKKLYKIIKNENPDIIISFLPEPTIRILSLKKYFKDKKIIISMRNNPKNEFPFILKYIRNYYYKFADVIVIQSDCYKKYLPNYLINKCITIPNYVKEDFYKISCFKKEDVIVSVGRLERQKNYKLLIKAFYDINKRYPNYKLHIYGEGKQRKKIESYINGRKLKNQVILKGISNNINNEIINSKMFVLTSNYEGMPNALLEAMSLGLPVVATNCSPIIPEIIENNKNGIMVKKRNLKQLKSSIEYIINNDNTDMCMSAKKIIDFYNEEIIIKKWIKLIGE